jgi:cysteine-rich repeat protein
MRGWMLALLGACYQASGLDDFGVAEEETRPSCGDGVVGRDEHCEDGNDVPDDGCTECLYDCKGPGELVDSATGHCYRLVGEAHPWREAQLRCDELGASFGLAAPATLAERDLIMPLVVPLNSSVWLGGGDEVMEGAFQWLNGEPFIYPGGAYPWLPGEPNNGAGLGDEDCIELQPNGMLNDQVCPVPLPYICERP